MPPSDQSNLGNVLLDMGVVTMDVLKEAVLEQMDSAGARLGEVLVSQHVISSHTLDFALRVQKALRSGDRLLAGMIIMEFQAGRMDRSLDRSTALVDEVTRRVA